MHKKYFLRKGVFLQNISKYIYYQLFTPKFGNKNAGTRSFQDCVNQGID